MDPNARRLHASCVACQGRALLILGPSGAGKSGLALQLMACGAALVADDQTELFLRDGWPMARAPATLNGRIEARGLGILAAPAQGVARLVAAVDLGQTETMRLPPDRHIRLLDHDIALFHKVESAHFPAALWQYLQGGKAMI